MVIILRQRVYGRETVEGRREVAGLEVVGGCRFVPFLAAVLVRALGRAGREGGRKYGSGCNIDFHTIRVVVVRHQGTSARVRQHAVVPKMVFQVPDVRESRVPRPGRRRDRGEVSGVRKGSILPHSE